MEGVGQRLVSDREREQKEGLRPMEGLALEGERQEEESREVGQLRSRLTPGLPSTPKAREGRVGPWEELGLEAP